VVDAQRACAVIVQRQQTHQAAIRLLVDWVVLEQALRVVNGLGVVAPHLQKADQLREHIPMLLTQPLALWDDPVVIAAGEQICAVQLSSSLQGSKLAVGVL
jgi:hypothetical protein